jgi:hypothetical protein
MLGVFADFEKNRDRQLKEYREGPRARRADLPLLTQPGHTIEMHCIKFDELFYGSDLPSSLRWTPPTCIHSAWNRRDAPASSSPRATLNLN